MSMIFQRVSKFNPFIEKKKLALVEKSLNALLEKRNSITGVLRNSAKNVPAQVKKKGHDSRPRTNVVTKPRGEPLWTTVRGACVPRPDLGPLLVRALGTTRLHILGTRVDDEKPRSGGLAKCRVIFEWPSRRRMHREALSRHVWEPRWTGSSASDERDRVPTSVEGVSSAGSVW